MAKINFAENAYGIKVKRWCASCALKTVTAEGERRCKLKNLMVKKDQVCKQWTMNNSLSKAGMPPKEDV